MAMREFEYAIYAIRGILYEVNFGRNPVKSTLILILLLLAFGIFMIAIGKFFSHIIDYLKS